MDENGQSPERGDLQRMQSELWSALRREEDPELRMNLLSRLSENRAAILALDSHDRPSPGLLAAVPAPPTPSAAWSGDGYPAGGYERRRGVSPAFAVPPSAFDGPPSAVSAFAHQADPPVAPLMPPPPPPGSRPTGTGPAPGRGGLVATSLAARAEALAGRLGDPRSVQRIMVLGGAVVSVLAIAWFIMAQPFGGGGETAAGAGGDASASETTVDHVALADQISDVLQTMGMSTVTAVAQADAIHLSGTVTDEIQHQTALDVARTLVKGEVEVVDELTVAATASTAAVAGGDPVASRAAALQQEINRVVAATPLIFETGKTDLTELHVRILNNVASILRAYPGVAVKIIGYTDHIGSADANAALSEKRAASVKAYLVSQGVPEVDLITEARGSTTSTGSSELASLERRVELEVATTPTVTPAVSDKPPRRIALVAPSASNDLAFTQSMVDAVNVVATERGGVEVDITDNTFVPEDAAAAIRGYAESDYDLIIAHGVEFGTELLTIVQDHPGTVFAWGTATDTFDLPNLYAYDAAAEEGGFVMGAMAAMLSTKGTVGVVGPIEVADAKRYVNGFKAGVLAEKPTANVPVTYTGSFADIALASEAATGHVAAGADVLTGTAEMVVGAIQVAQSSKVLWFGTQANQASLAPDIVVASQVYHWEVLLRQVVADIDAGTPNGRALVAKLDNGGLVLELNPGYPLPEPVRQRADQLTTDIKSGALAVPAG